MNDNGCRAEGTQVRKFLLRVPETPYIHERNTEFALVAPAE